MSTYTEYHETSAAVLPRNPGFLRALELVAESEDSAETFFRTLADTSINETPLGAFAVWLLADDGTLKVVADPTKPMLAEMSVVWKSEQHRHLIHETVVENQPRMLPCERSMVNGESATSILIPARDFESPRVVLEGIPDPSCSREELDWAFNCMLSLGQISSKFLRVDSYRRLREQTVDQEQLHRFARESHESLSLRESGYTLVNDGRRVIGCDRISLLIRRGRQYHVKAISGTDAVNRRSCQIRAMERLAGVVAHGMRPVWCTDEAETFAPQIESVLQTYLDESQARMVAVVPLSSVSEMNPAIGSSAVKNDSRDDVPVGVLIVDNFRSAEANEKLRVRTKLVASHAATAVRNALQHDLLFVSAGRVAARLLSPVFRYRTLTAFAVLLGLSVGLAIIPAELEISADGVLEPVLQRNIFAAEAGIVHEVLVEHGDDVEIGHEVLRLEDMEVSIELARLNGEFTTTVQRLRGVQQELIETAGITVTERGRLESDEQQLIARLGGLRDQIYLQNSRVGTLVHRSPQAGRVITWDVRRELVNRPVRRGDLLLTIADTDGPWEVELWVPANRIGTIANARYTSEEPLRVEFILLTRPQTTLCGTVIEIHDQAQVRQDIGNSVLVRVAFDRSQLTACDDDSLSTPSPSAITDVRPLKFSELRRGTVVRAHILCGSHPLGVVWFHEVISFFYSHVLFYVR